MFLLSTTRGGETSAQAAGLATIADYQEHDVIGSDEPLAAEPAGVVNPPTDERSRAN